MRGDPEFRHRAVLRKVDLSRANLHQADLSEANLREASLQGADLTGANLSGADLGWAILSQAVVDEATVVSDQWQLVWEIVNLGGAGRDMNHAFFLTQPCECGIMVTTCRYRLW